MSAYTFKIVPDLSAQAVADAVEALPKLPSDLFERVVNHFVHLFERFGDVTFYGEQRSTGAGQFEIGFGFKLSRRDRVFLSAIRAGDVEILKRHLHVPSSVVSHTTDDGMPEAGVQPASVKPRAVRR